MSCVALGMSRHLSDSCFLTPSFYASHVQGSVSGTEVPKRPGQGRGMSPALSAPGVPALPDSQLQPMKMSSGLGAEQTAKEQQGTALSERCPLVQIMTRKEDREVGSMCPFYGKGTWTQSWVLYSAAYSREVVELRFDPKAASLSSLCSFFTPPLSRASPLLVSPTHPHAAIWAADSVPWTAPSPPTEAGPEPWTTCNTNCGLLSGLSSATSLPCSQIPQLGSGPDETALSNLSAWRRCDKHPRTQRRGS